MYSTQTIDQQKTARQQALLNYKRKNLNAATVWRIDLVALIIVTAGLTTTAGVTAGCAMILGDINNTRTDSVIAQTNRAATALPRIEQPKPESRSNSHGKSSY